MYLRKMRPRATCLYSAAVHVAAHLVGGGPELLLKTEVGELPFLATAFFFGALSGLGLNEVEVIEV